VLGVTTQCSIKHPSSPEGIIKIYCEDMNTNTKYWSLTWETNVKQKILPSITKLLSFLNSITDEAVFQTERGSEKGKLHYQGTFTLFGPRKSKSATLRLFQGEFKNISGLTITPVYDKVAINKYVTKETGRVDGPFYGGKNCMYDKQFASMKLRKWQQELYDIIKGPLLDSLKDRKVIYIQNETGNSGKSWFQKWLAIGQRQLVSKALPISGVDRLISAVNILNKKMDVDVYTIDLTRTKGEDQSFKDLFAAVESIKNGYVVDVMYGKYNEAIFKPPIIIIFSNYKFEEFKDYLSADRWVPFTVGKGNELAEITTNEQNQTRYVPVKHLTEKYYGLKKSDHLEKKNSSPQQENSK
jgi:hypothetical protein